MSDATLIEERRNAVEDYRYRRDPCYRCCECKRQRGALWQWRLCCHRTGEGCQYVLPGLSRKSGRRCTDKCTDTAWASITKEKGEHSECGVLARCSFGLL